MSVRASRIVWRARLPPHTKIVLLALADFLNEETGRLDPSLQKLADKVGVSRCQVQRVVRLFIREGLVAVVANQSGGHPGATPRYRMNLDAIAQLPTTGVDEWTDGADATGSTRATDSVDETDRALATGSTQTTGIASAVEGSHGCTEGVAPMRCTGSARTTQTGKNRNQPEEEPEAASTSPAVQAPGSKHRLAPISMPGPTVADLVAAGMPIQTAAEFIPYKTKMKAPLTHRAWIDHQRESEKAGWSIGDAAEKVMAKSWKGFEAKYVATERPAPPQSRHAGFATKNYREGLSQDEFLT